MLVILLGLRFVLELALVASVGLVGARLTTAPVLGWVLAAGLVAVAVAIWGVFIAPRRRIDLSLAVRVIIELTLFASAAWGLAWIGQPTLGLALLVAEVTVVGALWVLGHPPGSDAGTRGTAPRP